MAKKKTTKKKSSKKKSSSRSAAGASKKRSSKKTSSRRSPGRKAEPINAAGKQLVIVESPAKARTINKYLGSDFAVAASVGHVRDLPTRAKKGQKQPVPGVDLEHDFAPTYEVLPDKKKIVSELKRAASTAADVWFATDLDREGEAIAWHLAQELGVDPARAKRVVFNAITKAEIEKAFAHPHSIDQAKVNAQQARRVLDRIVGYRVSPLLWKKVARGLSAGRVQSVAVRLVVEREREIKAFTPDEYWKVSAGFALSESRARTLAPEWRALLDSKDDKGNSPTQKQQNAWLAEQGAVRADLVEVGGEPFDLKAGGTNSGGEPADPTDLYKEAVALAERAGLTNAKVELTDDEDGKGPAARIVTVTGEIDPAVPYRVRSIETKRTTSRPGAPFITSTLQQAASSKLGFGAQRTMRTAQQLYEGVDIKGEGSVGLITYMRTDSTHLAKDAIDSVRGHISSRYGGDYLPEKPNFYGSSNKAAQEAHEAIRPASLEYPPEKVAGALKPDQLKLYKLIWARFVACQMTPAKWDSTSVLIEGGKDQSTPLTFRASGRTLAFDGFYRATGVPTASDEQTLPELEEDAAMSPFFVAPEQKFTSPPARYSEASLIKKLESEGIGRPSTYASIIQVIQDRNYVEQLQRRFYATDLGEVVTDKLIEAFPRIMELGYTREMEADLDKIEDEHTDWIDTLRRFYGPFEEQLEKAHEELKHAKAEIRPAPAEYKCETCGAGLVYRFGKNGRFLSCERYPDCEYACPCDRDGKPQPIEHADVACVKCGEPMIKRTGRFGPFFGCSAYPECDGILKCDKQGRPLAPQPPPLETDLPCPKCESPLYLRNGARGPWLSCSAFPKCRGRGKWSELDDEKKAELEKALAAHEKEHPIPTVKTLDGEPLTDKKGKPLEREDDGADSESAAA